MRLPSSQLFDGFKDYSDPREARAFTHRAIEAEESRRAWAGGAFHSSPQARSAHRGLFTCRLNCVHAGLLDAIQSLGPGI